MTHQPTPKHAPHDGWRTRAACRDSDTRLFTEPGNSADAHQALATCATCSVRAACLEIALAHDAEADVGIWGGTTEPTRHQIRAGHLTIEQVLDPAVRRNPEPRETQVCRSGDEPRATVRTAHACHNPAGAQTTPFPSLPRASVDKESDE